MFHAAWGLAHSLRMIRNLHDRQNIPYESLLSTRPVLSVRSG